MLALYFIFVHLILLVPGYMLVKKTRLLKGKPGFELCAAYLVSIVVLAAFAIMGYALNVPRDWLQAGSWLLLGVSMVLFWQQKLYKDLLSYKIPLTALLAISIFSCAFINLSFTGSKPYYPDPQFITANNYETLNVKVLNVAQTPANDNYVPYRQAQFMVNRSDPAKDSFIDEWGVHFFQRTPLMGAVTAQFFTLLGDTPPINYTWSPTGHDPSMTYEKFQIIGQIMNSLFVLPAFFLLTRLFNRKTAVASLLFIIPSHFFLYNSIFTWPKSLVAFFILFSWMLLFEKCMRFVVLAAIASGVAYLAHDLAIFYVGASVLLLLYWRRFRDILLFVGVNILFALPWLITSALIYRKPSTFIYYPFSLHGIPQLDQKEAIIREFFSTSPFRILAIKLDSLLYLMSPYQLLFSEGGQAMGRRMWAVGLFNVPGALGLGLIIPAVLGAFKKIRHNLPFWILALGPILITVLFLGAPRLVLGAMHFAEASVVLLIGLAVWFLLSLKHSIWLLLAFAANMAYAIWFMVYSYGFTISAWLGDISDLAMMFILVSIIALCGWFLPKVAKSGETA